MGTEVKYDKGLPVVAVCATCGSFDIEPCAAPAAGRPVPMRVLRSAEAQALHWKKQAERLSDLINRAAQAKALGTNYVTEAKMIQAGMV
jgi:hypothetical protein